MIESEQTPFQIYIHLLTKTYSQSSTIDKLLEQQLTNLLKKLLQQNLILPFTSQIILDNSHKNLKLAACNSLARSFELDVPVSNVNQIFQGLMGLVKNQGIEQNVVKNLIESALKRFVNNYLKERGGDITNYILKNLYAEIENKGSNLMIIRLVELAITVLLLFEADDLFDFLRDNDHFRLLSEHSFKYMREVRAQFERIDAQPREAILAYDFLGETRMIEVVYGLVSLFNEVLVEIYENDEFHGQAVDTLNQYDTFCQFLVDIMAFNIQGQDNIICLINIPIAHRMNQLKSHAMTLAETTLSSCPDIFGLCIHTLIKFTNENKKNRNVENILANMFILLERLSIDKKHEKFILEERSSLIIILLNYCVSNEQEYEQMRDEPENFVLLSTEFCEEQDQTLVKIKAISFLSFLCMTFDGILTLVFQTSFIIADSIIQKHDVEIMNKYQPILQMFEDSCFMKQKEEAKLQTCLLVFAALVDQIQPRKDIFGHLEMFLTRRFQELILYESEIIKCRIIHLASYIPTKYIIDTYVELFKRNPSPAVKDQIVNSYRSLISRGHKSEELRFNVGEAGFRLLEFLPTLNTLFAQIVMNNPDFINDDDKVEFIISRLVNDIVTQFDQPTSQLVHHVDRYVSTILAFIKDIPRIKGFQKLFIPALSTITKSKNTQQSIIELACGLIERMREITSIQSQFLIAIGEGEILQKNNFVLNNLTELMNLHFFYKTSIPDKIISFILKPFEVAVESGVSEDIADILMLFQNYLVQRTANQVVIRTIMTGLIQVLGTNVNESTKFRLITTIFSGFYNHPTLFQSIIPQPLYSQILQYSLNIDQKLLFTRRFLKNHCIYMMSIAEAECTKTNSLTCRIVHSVIQIFQAFAKLQPQQVQNKIFSQIQSDIYNSENNKLKLAILWKTKSYKHPLDSVDECIFFTEKIDNIVRVAGATIFQDINKDLINKYYHNQQVGTNRRKILKVKRKQYQ